MKIHSFESMGAVDGPGLRCVIFLQGCPIRCRYCHNPDTRPFAGGMEISGAELRRRLNRMREYFGSAGGVTVSGGEPLASPAVCSEILDICREEKIHVAIDTAGAFLDPGDRAEALSVAARADMLILDIKHPDPDVCARLTGRDNAGALALLGQAEQTGQRVWIRHVVVPGWSADSGSLTQLHRLVSPYKCVEKVELIAFHRLGCEKYEKMGLPYPMGDAADLPPGEIEHWRNFYAALN